MIPTIRSMVFAALLTVTVLVGGFGLFAAFRVNHEPLARLPVAAMPFQLASIDTAPRALSFAPDQPRLESNEALRAVATVVTARDPEAAAAPAASSTGDVTDSAAPERVATASAQDSAGTGPSNNPASTVAPPDTAAAVPPPDTAQSRTADVGIVPVAETPQPETAVVAAPPPGTAQPETIVTGSITEVPPQQAAAPKTAAAATPVDPQETAYQIAHRKRLAALRRARRARIAAHDQSTNQISGFGQSNFQSASGFQSAQSDIGGSLVSPSLPARRRN